MIYRLLLVICIQIVFLLSYLSNFDLVLFFFLIIRRPPRSTRTDTLFPTRRSSDLHDHAIEIFTGPGEHLVEARCVASARTQRRIGPEEDSVAHRDGGAQLPGRQRQDDDGEAAKLSTDSPGIFEKPIVLRRSQARQVWKECASPVRVRRLS